MMIKMVMWYMTVRTAALTSRNIDEPPKLIPIENANAMMLRHMEEITRVLRGEGRELMASIFGVFL